MTTCFTPRTVQRTTLGWGYFPWGYGAWGSGVTVQISEDVTVTGGWGEATWGHFPWGHGTILTAPTENSSTVSAITNFKVMSAAEGPQILANWVNPNYKVVVSAEGPFDFSTNTTIQINIDGYGVLTVADLADPSSPAATSAAYVAEVIRTRMGVIASYPVVCQAGVVHVGERVYIKAGTLTVTYCAGSAHEELFGITSLPYTYTTFQEVLVKRKVYDYPAEDCSSYEDASYIIYRSQFSGFDYLSDNNYCGDNPLFDDTIYYYRSYVLESGTRGVSDSVDFARTTCAGWTGNGILSVTIDGDGPHNLTFTESELSAKLDPYAIAGLIQDKINELTPNYPRATGRSVQEAVVAFDYDSGSYRIYSGSFGVNSSVVVTESTTTDEQLSTPNQTIGTGNTWTNFSMNSFSAAGGKLQLTANASGQQAGLLSVFEAGRKYTVSFTVEDYDVVTPFVDGFALYCGNQLVQTVTAVGDVEVDFTAQADGPLVLVSTSSTASAAFSSFSVEKFRDLSVYLSLGTHNSGTETAGTGTYYTDDTMKGYALAYDTGFHEDLLYNKILHNIYRTKDKETTGVILTATARELSSVVTYDLVTDFENSDTLYVSSSNFSPLDFPSGSIVEIYDELGNQAFATLADKNVTNQEKYTITLSEFCTSSFLVDNKARVRIYYNIGELFNINETGETKYQLARYIKALSLVLDREKAIIKHIAKLRDVFASTPEVLSLYAQTIGFDVSTNKSVDIQRLELLAYNTLPIIGGTIEALKTVIKLLTDIAPTVIQHYKYIFTEGSGSSPNLSAAVYGAEGPYDLHTNYKLFLEVNSLGAKTLEAFPTHPYTSFVGEKGPYDVTKDKFFNMKIGDKPLVEIDCTPADIIYETGSINIMTIGSSTSIIPVTGTLEDFVIGDLVLVNNHVRFVVDLPDQEIIGELDRTFEPTSAWTNIDFDTFTPSGYLTIAATGVQQGYLPFSDIEIGVEYTITVVANSGSGAVFRIENGTETILTGINGAGTFTNTFTTTDSGNIVIESEATGSVELATISIYRTTANAIVNEALDIENGGAGYSYQYQRAERMFASTNPEKIIPENNRTFYDTNDWYNVSCDTFSNLGYLTITSSLAGQSCRLDESNIVSDTRYKFSFTVVSSTAGNFEFYNGTQFITGFDSSDSGNRLTVHFTASQSGALILYATAVPADLELDELSLIEVEEVLTEEDSLLEGPTSNWANGTFETFEYVDGLHLGSTGASESCTLSSTHFSVVAGKSYTLAASVVNYASGTIGVYYGATLLHEFSGDDYWYTVFRAEASGDLILTSTAACDMTFSFISLSPAYSNLPASDRELIDVTDWINHSFHSFSLAGADLVVQSSAQGQYAYLENRQAHIEEDQGYVVSVDVVNIGTEDVFLLRNGSQHLLTLDAGDNGSTVTKFFTADQAGDLILYCTSAPVEQLVDADRYFLVLNNWVNVDFESFTNKGSFQGIASAALQYGKLPQANNYIVSGKTYKLEFYVRDLSHGEFSVFLDTQELIGSTTGGNLTSADVSTTKEVIFTAGTIGDLTINADSITGTEKITTVNDRVIGLGNHWADFNLAYFDNTASVIMSGDIQHYGKLPALNCAKTTGTCYKLSYEVVSLPSGQYTFYNGTQVLDVLTAAGTFDYFFRANQNSDLKVVCSSDPIQAIQPNNRYFTGTNEWTNDTFASASVADDKLSITSGALGQFCHLPSTSITPMVGISYRITVKTGTIAGTTFKINISGDLAFTISTSNTTYTHVFQSTGYGNLYIISNGAGSGEFLEIALEEFATIELNNFSLTEIGFIDLDDLSLEQLSEGEFDNFSLVKKTEILSDYNRTIALGNSWANDTTNPLATFNNAGVLTLLSDAVGQKARLSSTYVSLVNRGYYKISCTCASYSAGSFYLKAGTTTVLTVSSATTFTGYYYAAGAVDLTLESVSMTSQAVLTEISIQQLPNVLSLTDTDFSGYNRWQNVDFTSFAKSGSLTVTASGIGEYCILPFEYLNAVPTKNYRLAIEVGTISAADTFRINFSGYDTGLNSTHNGTTVITPTYGCSDLDLIFASTSTTASAIINAVSLFLMDDEEVLPANDRTFDGDYDWQNISLTSLTTAGGGNLVVLASSVGQYGEVPSEMLNLVIGNTYIIRFWIDTITAGDEYSFYNGDQLLFDGRSSAHNGTFQELEFIANQNGPLRIVNTIFSTGFASTFSQFTLVEVNEVLAYKNKTFSVVNDWENISMTGFDKPGLLRITGNNNQTCHLPEDYVSVTVGEYYLLEIDIASILGSFSILLGNQILTTIVAGDTEVSVEFQAEEVGDLVLVATQDGSSGDFDNFSLKALSTLYSNDVEIINGHDRYFVSGMHWTNVSMDYFYQTIGLEVRGLLAGAKCRLLNEYTPVEKDKSYHVSVTVGTVVGSLAINCGGQAIIPLISAADSSSTLTAEFVATNSGNLFIITLEDNSSAEFTYISIERAEIRSTDINGFQTLEEGARVFFDSQMREVVEVIEGDNVILDSVTTVASPVSYRTFAPIQATAQEVCANINAALVADGSYGTGYALASIVRDDSVLVTGLLTTGVAPDQGITFDDPTDTLSSALETVFGLTTLPHFAYDDPVPSITTLDETFDLSGGAYLNISLDNLDFIRIDCSDGAASITAVTKTELAAALNAAFLAEYGIGYGTEAVVSGLTVVITALNGSSTTIDKGIAIGVDSEDACRTLFGRPSPIYVNSPRSVMATEVVNNLNDELQRAYGLGVKAEFFNWDNHLSIQSTEPSSSAEVTLSTGTLSALMELFGLSAGMTTLSMQSETQTEDDESFYTVDLEDEGQYSYRGLSLYFDDSQNTITDDMISRMKILFPKLIPAVVYLRVYINGIFTFEVLNG